MFLKKHEKEELNIHDSYAKIHIFAWSVNVDFCNAQGSK